MSGAAWDKSESLQHTEEKITKKKNTAGKKKKKKVAGKTHCEILMGCCLSAHFSLSLLVSREVGAQPEPYGAGGRFAVDLMLIVLKCSEGCQNLELRWKRTSHASPGREGG